MKLKCPICRKVEVTTGDPEFPFCSERCRTIDLGNWAMEKYAIPTPADPNALTPDDDEEA